MTDILHIGVSDRMLDPFVNFVNSNFEPSQHEFLLLSERENNDIAVNSNVRLNKRSILGNIRYFFLSIIKMNKAKKIVLHGLFDINLVVILFFMPWLSKKCYWFVWGSDLYVYQVGERNWKWNIKELFRRPVIKNIGNIVTYIKGDYELARKWYRVKGRYHECFMYPSNLYKDFDVPEKQHSCKNVLVGNSADPCNNHLEVFVKLDMIKNKDIKIYVPLSYGNQEYARKVIEEGMKRFGSKFVPLTEVMPYYEYLRFLGSIDIAIFNHKRQQAMGNTISLLGLGKKIYMRSDVTQWEFLKDQGIMIYDIFDLEVTCDFVKEVESMDKNKKIVREYFSIEKYRKDLEKIFLFNTSVP